MVLPHLNEGKSMEINGGERLRKSLALSAVFLGLMMLLPVVSAGQTQTVPASYKIQGVPLYQQIDARGCGAASLQMVFDYYGPLINQMEIYDAARSGGTALPDMARAAQFSTMSTTAGDRFQQGETTGYRERAVGYAGFFYASSTPWLSQLKSIVAQGYPVIVLVNWLPNVYGPHYRVVVGYDDTKGVLMMNDPWSREFKNDMNYQGSTSQAANTSAWDVDFGTFNMTYSDFLNIWALSTSGWGVPGLAYGAVLVTPWQVHINAPQKVAPGKAFTVSATITYPCLAPFGSSSFPTFTASDFSATLSVGNGLSVQGSPIAVAKGTLSAAQQVTVSWTVRAGGAQGQDSLTVDATGIVSGSLGQWHDYPAYSYQDTIGGSGSSSVWVST
jgi:uncharacterized protein YvpB